MKDDLIYIKTPTGEDAVQERTRLVQRNLRMVLILIDGVVNVASLKQEVGDSAMVESALTELERLGLIETSEVAKARAASEIETLPFVSNITMTTSEPVVEVPLVQTDTVFDEETAAQVLIAAKYSPAAVVHPEQVKAQRKSPLTDISGWWQATRQERAQAKEEALYEAAYGKDAVEEIDARPPPPPKRPGVTVVFRWSWLVIGAVGVVALALLTLVLFPYDNYRPEFEQRLSQALGDEVKIGEVRLGFSPYPGIVLERVSVGADPYLTANHVQLLPEFGSLFGPRYREAQVDGVRVKEFGLGRFSKWFLPAGMGDAAVARLEITGLAVDLAGGSIEGLRGTARVDDQQGLSKLVLRGKEGDLRIEVSPGATGVGLSLSATSWTAPFHPELLFSFLEMRGELVPGRLTMNSIDGRLYDGSLTGDGAITWTQEANLTLKLTFQRLAADRLLPALGAEPFVDGALSGKVQVNSKAVALQRLDKDLQMEGSFTIERGSLKHVDLAEAIRSGQQTTLRGGTTHFQEFSGAFAVDAHAVRFSGLQMSSGLMRVAGQMSLSRPDGALSGRAGMEMRGSATAAKAAVTISGNAKEPEIKVNRGG
jgi:hypothetical protein